MLHVFSTLQEKLDNESVMHVCIRSAFSLILQRLEGIQKHFIL